jgi:hypothetical protein
MSMAGRRRGIALTLIATGLAAVGLASASERDGRHGGGGHALDAATTGRRAELRETVPIATRPGAKPRVVLSLGPKDLPRLRSGDRLQARSEITVTTTCVEPIPRCIGRSYGFDPEIGARLVLGRDDDSTGRHAKRVSRRVSLSCEQHRPNRNHHCPLVLDQAGLTINRPRRLPCHPNRCHLNLVLDASNRAARGGEVVVVGADQPDGSVEGGKGRLAAVVVHNRRRVESTVHRTADLRTHKLPARFSGGNEVVLSERLDDLREGDVLVVRSRQLTAIKDLPYFVSSQIIVTTRRNSTEPSDVAKRSISRLGTLTEVNGFNCTPGPSAFQSPCTSKKTGIATIERDPRDARGHRRRLFVNVVSRSFPKVAQERTSSYPPARVLEGKLEVERLRPAR